MASELIGHRRCPLCGAAARLGLMKTGLTCLTCNGCNTQTFARSGRSDELLRDLPVAEPARNTQQREAVTPAGDSELPRPGGDSHSQVVVTAAPGPAQQKQPVQAPKPAAPVRTAPPTPKAAPAAEPEAPAWGWNTWMK